MKKLISWFLLFSFVFALFLEVTNSEDWSWRGYIEFVTENIKPFPEADLTFAIPESGDFSFLEKVGEFFSWLGALLIYPIECVFTILHNFIVILDGFLPFNFSWEYVPDTGGSGIGGGGGGIR